MRRRGSIQRASLLSILVVVVFVTAGAQAQVREHTTTASELALQAKAMFDRGEFRQAAELLKQAYTVEPTSALLYNLGRAHQQAGDKLLAIEAYEQYLAQAGHPSDEGAVIATVAQLRSEIQRDEELRQRAEQERRAAEEAEAKRRSDALRFASLPARHAASALPWVVTGVGVAGVAAGVVLVGVAASEHASAQSAPDVATASSRQNQALTLATASTVSFITAGVLVLAGVVWGLLDVRASARSRRAALLDEAAALRIRF